MITDYQERRPMVDPNSTKYISRVNMKLKLFWGVVNKNQTTDMIADMLCFLKQ